MEQIGAERVNVIRYVLLIDQISNYARRLTHKRHMRDRNVLRTLRIKANFDLGIFGLGGAHLYCGDGMVKEKEFNGQWSTDY